MSSGRLASAVAAVAILAGGGRPAAQAPALAGVLERSAAYVADFRAQLSGIVAEETYTQEIVSIARVPRPLSDVPRRTLRSELLLIKPAGAERYVEMRDVFEVDGRLLPHREGRLEALVLDPSRRADLRIGEIIAESARFNIGSVTRNINTPLMPLQFLDAVNQPRFRFRHLPKAAPIFAHEANTPPGTDGVFRVSTEMWTIEYEEREKPTIIRRPGGGDQPARGRFWIDPNDGSVLISELVVNGGGIVATITVSYQSEPLMGFLVPTEMRETYVRNPERITGHARYGKFRPIAKSANQ